MGSSPLNTLLVAELKSGISYEEWGESPAPPVWGESTGPRQYTQFNRASRSPLVNQASLLHGIALRNSDASLTELQRKLFVISNPAELSLVRREIAVRIRDIGILLALPQRPTTSYSLVDVSRLLRLLTHMLSAADDDPSSHISEAVHEAALYLYGGLFSSHCGIAEIANALEDVKFEHTWLKCWFGERLSDQSLVSEIRKAPGVLSIAEEIQKCASEFSLSPSFHIPIKSIGAATTSLIDCWRTAQVILQLHLGDMDQVRRHSDVIRRACLELAKLCTYECGREVTFHFIKCL